MSGPDALSENLFYTHDALRGLQERDFGPAIYPEFAEAKWVTNVLKVGDRRWGNFNGML
jgi:hypothetical protein